MHADGSSTDVVIGDGSGWKGCVSFLYHTFLNPLLPLLLLSL